MMEKRWSRRTPINLDVALRYDGLGMLRGRARDLSLEGMFIDTGRVVLPDYAVVEINFAVSEGDTRRVHAVHAVVVRTARSGVGTMFRQVSSASVRALRTLMPQA